MQEAENNSNEFRVAVHEAAHIAMRYILFGNIDIIKGVSVGEKGGSLGRVTEDTKKKWEEYENEMGEPTFDEVGGYAFKECCYSLAGVVADMINDGMQEIPYYNSDEDFESLYSFIGLSDDKIDKLLEAATPHTIEIVEKNFQTVKQLATAIIEAPGMELSNDTLNKVLPNLFHA